MKLKVRMKGEQKDEALPHRPCCAENAALLLGKVAIVRSEMFDIHGCRNHEGCMTQSPRTVLRIAMWGGCHGSGMVFHPAIDPA